MAPRHLARLQPHDLVAQDADGQRHAIEALPVELHGRGFCPDARSLDRKTFTSEHAENRPRVKRVEIGSKYKDCKSMEFTIDSWELAWNIVLTFLIEASKGSTPLRYTQYE